MNACANFIRIFLALQIIKSLIKAGERSMILRKVLALKNSINEYRQNMVELAGKKGLSDPQVIRISQQLDGEIIKWEKFIQEIHPLSKEIRFYKLKSKV